MIRVDVWSDMICPFCYIGKKRLENVAAEAGVQLDVYWHSYELDPHSPRVLDGTLAERIAKKYGLTLADSIERQIELAENAETEGVDFQWEKARPGNTFDAHRLAHLAAERGRGGAFEERAFHAYMSEGQAIGEPDVLLRLAVEAGLDEAEAREVLESERYAQEVREDEQFAQTQLGVRGVPFFVFEGSIGMSGAQPRAMFREALKQAAAAQAGAATQEPPASAGASCEGESCGVPQD